MSEDYTDVEGEVDIEEIMQEIRQKILAQQANLPAHSRPLVTVGGERFPPEFYEHLYQANLAYNQIGVKMHVTSTSIPLLGPIVDRLRRMVHRLVIFYVNQTAQRQIEVNAHLLQAVSLLGQALEEEESDEPAGTEEA